MLLAEIHRPICRDHVVSSLEEKIRDSRKIISRAVAQYGKKSLFLSFNGGKDSIVILSLLREVLGSLDGINAVYFQNSQEFPEVLSTIERYTEIFDFTLIRKTVNNLAEGVSKLCEGLEEPVGFLLAVRRGDPHSDNLKIFEESSPAYGHFCRVHPILDWNVYDIWTYLTSRGLIYPALYDRGYTSLGNLENTFRNPFLVETYDLSCPKCAVDAKASLSFAEELKETDPLYANYLRSATKCPILVPFSSEALSPQNINMFVNETQVCAPNCQTVFLKPVKIPNVSVERVMRK